MNRIHFPFNSIADEGFFSSVGDVLNTKPENDLIKVPVENGEGSLVLKTIDQGLMFLSFDLTLNKSLVIEKKPLILSNNEKSFIITYILQADNIYIEGSAAPGGFHLKPGRKILFMADDADLKIEVPPGETIKAINVCVNALWLQKEMGGTNESVTEFLNQLNANTIPDIFLGSGTASELKVLAELNRNLIDNNTNVLFFKARILSLVSDFFFRLFNKSLNGSLGKREIKDERMIEVEHLLEAHLEKKLPGLEEIARDMAMSISTLKRHFKAMYGKNIYEHYLQLKMEHAKRLLLEKPLSVNEVAYKLEYEKVSCFIDMFKKVHGISPGMLRRASA